MASQYNRYSRRPSSGRKREILATEEMKKLVPTSRICINTEGDTIFVYNGQARPITATLGDPLATIKILQPKVMTLFKKTEVVVVEWCGLLSDELLRLEQEPEEDGDEEDRKVCYVNKYSKGIRLLESIIINDQPRFIQLKEGSKTDFNLLSEFSTNSRVIKPYDAEQQGYPYVFESEDEIKYYLKLACRLTPNLNLDSIFKLLKTEFKQYVVLDDHYITLLVADTIWSLLQDKFSTTHYVFCLGDNSSGKNAILLTYYSFGYRVFMAGSVSGPNVLSALGNVESGQISLAEDEVNNLDNEHDKMTIWKMGYCQTGSRVPKTDLNNGRKQDLYYTYCFKICASERSLDNMKARGLLDRCFTIPCIAGKPAHNIKRVRENTKKNKHLMNEIEKTRKLLFAIRIVHYDDIIDEIGLNVFNREAELTEPTIRLFQHSPDTLKELLPALTKCLNNKREVKSNSLEAILYAVINNLIPKITTINDEYVDLSNDDIKEELKRITDGTDILNKDAFRSKELGEDITWSKIWQILKDKFRASTITIGTGDMKRRGRRFTKKDLESKSIDYNVPDYIKIEPINDIPHGPDNFDSLVNGHESGTPSGDNSDESGTPGTHHESMEEGKNERVGTPGTPGTPSGDNNEDVNDNTRASSTNETERENDHEDVQKSVLPHDLPMSEDIDDDMDVVKEEEIEPYQKPPTESWNPIISLEEFFTDDLSLSSHDFEESPCFPIIDIQIGESSTDRKYFCKLHPDFKSDFIETIERHCKQTEPEFHKDAILAKDDSV